MYYQRWTIYKSVSKSSKIYMSVTLYIVFYKIINLNYDPFGGSAFKFKCPYISIQSIKTNKLNWKSTVYIGFCNIIWI